MFNSKIGIQEHINEGIRKFLMLSENFLIPFLMTIMLKYI